MKCAICSIAFEEGMVSFHYNNASVCGKCYCGLSQMAIDVPAEEITEESMKFMPTDEFIEAYNMANKKEEKYKKDLEKIKDKNLFVCPQCFNYVAFDKDLELKEKKKRETTEYKEDMVMVAFTEKQECPCGYKKKDFYKVEKL